MASFIVGFGDDPRVRRLPAPIKINQIESARHLENTVVAASDSVTLPADEKLPALVDRSRRLHFLFVGVGRRNQERSRVGGGRQA
jgi:hypothetical protein